MPTLRAMRDLWFDNELGPEGDGRGCTWIRGADPVVGFVGSMSSVDLQGTACLHTVWHAIGH